MPRCVVIADDLTGADAAGVLLLKRGLRAFTVLNPAADPAALSRYDCILCPTGSRVLPPEDAYERVRRAAAALCAPDTRLFSKRIDSTLRGNLGAETDAMLDLLGRDALAFVVPAFPASGRVLAGGYLLVHGIPLDRTEAASDPVCPVDTAQCATLFRRQSNHPVASLYLGDLRRGAGFLQKKLRALSAGGARCIVCDAASDADIDLLADAAAGCGRPFVAVDPGVFTAALAGRMLGPIRRTEQGRVLAVVGSVNPVAAAQAEHFLSHSGAFGIRMNTVELLEGPARREREIARVLRALCGEAGNSPKGTAESADGGAAAVNPAAVVLGDGIDPTRRVNLAEYGARLHRTSAEVSDLINTAFAEVAERALTADARFQGLYLSGGDITAAVCARLQSDGIRLCGEVLPLAAYGTLEGGRFPGLRVVTKGGMVGGPEAMTLCVRHLLERLPEMPDAPG